MTSLFAAALTLTSLFDQSAQLSTFLLCLLAGLVYVVSSAAMGAIFGGDGSDDSHGDISGDNDTDHSTVSIFSPKIIAIFAIGLGGGGCIATAYGLSFTISLLVGLALGFALGALMVFGMRYLHSQRASSDIPTTSAVGQFATVNIAIPAGGTGEVSLTVLGQYMTYFARSKSNASFSKGSLAKVVGTNGGTLIVE